MYRIDKGDVFVFGSNLAGRHGRGAALTAKKEYGAKNGKVGSVGFHGQSFAIPTKDENIKTLPLSKIKPYVNLFIEFVKSRQDLTFYVTPIGTGLAGYKHEEIAPMFKELRFCSNVKLCPEWHKIYEIYDQ